MTDVLGVVANVAVAISVCLVAFSTMRQVKEQRLGRLQREFEFHVAFEERLLRAIDRLGDKVGTVDDGLQPDDRAAYAELFVLAGQYLKATSSGLYSTSGADGVDAELKFWLDQPAVRSAWTRLGAHPEFWPDELVVRMRQKGTGGPVAD